MVTKQCDGCGEEFTAHSNRARWCPEHPDRCRKRAKRRAAKAPIEAVASEVFDATLALLRDTERVDTPAGALALVLARRIDASATDNASGVASLSKELLSVIGQATVNAKSAEPDPVDQLRERRERRRLGLRRRA